MKRDISFKALENAMMNDPTLRGVRHSGVFSEALRIEHLGLISWNYIAQIAFIETARRSASIERVKTVSIKMDSITTLSAITPNIRGKKAENGNFVDMEVNE